VRTLGGFVIALVVFAVAGEVLARALGVVDRLNGYTRFLYAASPDPDIPYVLRPGLVTTLVGVPVRLNHLGFRGPELPQKPTPGVPRVLLVGDSIVFGWRVAEDETLAAHLARALATADRATEVINAGVPGWDARSEVRWLETVGLGLGPDVVVVGTSLNDYDPPPTYSPLGVLVRRESGGTELLDRSEFVLVLRWLATWWRGGLWTQILDRAARTPLDFDAAVAEKDRRFWGDPPPAEWRRVQDAFGTLAAVGRAHDVPILVAIFPERWQVGTPDGDLAAQQRLRALCAAVGLRCLDLQPTFAAAGRDLFVDAQHPNGDGQAVAAAAIADALRGELRLPASAPRQGPGARSGARLGFAASTQYCAPSGILASSGSSGLANASGFGK
jgi:lysophospholipase L1-like esterase